MHCVALSDLINNADQNPKICHGGHKTRHRQLIHFVYNKRLSFLGKPLQSFLLNNDS